MHILCFFDCFGQLSRSYRFSREISRGRSCSCIVMVVTGANSRAFCLDCTKGSGYLGSYNFHSCIRGRGRGRGWCSFLTGK